MDEEKENISNITKRGTKNTQGLEKNIHSLNSKLNKDKKEIGPGIPFNCIDPETGERREVATGSEDITNKMTRAKKLGTTSDKITVPSLQSE